MYKFEICWTVASATEFTHTPPSCFQHASRIISASLDGSLLKPMILQQ
jgi:hypothetical protein